MTSPRPWVALALLGALVPLPAHADDAADFADEVRLLYRVVACTGDEPLPANIDAKVVDAHCKIFLPMMAKYRNKYLPQVDAFLKPLRPADLPHTVVYPFGGGDLNSALTTYPDATEYTTLSLEHAGDPRRIKTVNAARLEASLKLIRETIAGLVLANDSKSVNLSKGQRGDIPGQIAFFLVGLSLHDQVPVGLRYFHVNVDGSLHYYSRAELEANEGARAVNFKKQWQPPDFSEVFSNSEIAFVPKGSDLKGTPRIHRHIAANLANDFLTEDPSVLHHLELKGPVAAMTKAASYLLWNDFFSKIRDFLLQHAVFMVSDSTGIPPKIAKAGGFTQTTYGVFEKSFLPASEEINSDFRKLWNGEPKRPLPFRYGYIDGAKHFHLMITARTDKAPPIPPASTVAAAPTSTTPAAAKPAVAAAPTPAAILLPDGGSLAADVPNTVPATALPNGPEVTTKDDVEGGRHWRLMTDQGAVHVWRPPGFKQEGAGTIVYVHGYYQNVDAAWDEHQLAHQFLESHRNALFIVPEAPTGKSQNPTFTNLKDLLVLVSRLTRTRLPDGTVVAVGHSGAYRTIVSWLGYGRLSEVMLVDALYANEDEFRAWLTTAPHHTKNRLILVGAETADVSADFLKHFPLAAKLDSLPAKASDLPPRQSHAEVTYFKSQYEHMELVTSGKVLPMLLELTPIGAR